MWHFFYLKPQEESFRLFFTVLHTFTGLSISLADIFVHTFISTSNTEISPATQHVFVANVQMYGRYVKLAMSNAA